MSIIDQLSSFYKRPGFHEKLSHRYTRQKSNDLSYEDIYDGSVYKSLPTNFSENRNNITFTWNTDGVPLFKSSHVSIWPFYLMINELPYKLRIRKENMILAGLWFGPTKPCANLFMNSFIEELKNLHKGVDVIVADKVNPLRIRGLIICGTCDLGAKSQFLNIQQFNGKFGCPNCKIMTRRVEHVQIYPFTESLNLRTTEESEQYAKEARESKKPVFGIKGPSTLRLLVPDFINTTAIDAMHCIYQGITKKLMYLWFDEENRTHASSLFAFINIIDKNITKLTLPSFVPRIPRKVGDYAHWKASELKLFLSVYSLIILKNIMSAQYFEHHILLVQGISILNSYSITEEKIIEAGRVLKEYVRRFEILYGKKHLSCNLHLLLHLPDNVRKFGPLWTTSCFAFENLNGVLKSYVHGTRYETFHVNCPSARRASPKSCYF